MVTKTGRWMLFVGVMALVASACGSDTTDDASTDTVPVGSDAPEVQAATVVATTTILGDLVVNVAGDCAEVEVLMPAGADPHDYELSSAQAAELRGADVVFAFGLGLEEGVLPALDRAADDGVAVVEVAPLLDTIAFAGDHSHGDDDGHGHDEDEDEDHGHDDEGDDHAHDEDEDHGHDDDDHGHDEDEDHGHDDDGHGHDEDEDHGHDDEGDDHAHDEDDDHGHDDDGHGHEDGSPDPHVWQDPARMADAVAFIAEELAEHTECDQGGLEERAEAYGAELMELDAEMEELFAAIPAENRKLVTNHEAFGYLADRFDFEIIGTVIPGGTTLAEPSSAEMAALIGVIDQAGVPAIFGENVESTRLVEVLADETDADIEVVELHSDSLGEPGTGTGTYAGMMRTNAELIAAALGS